MPSVTIARHRPRGIDLNRRSAVFLSRARYDLSRLLIEVFSITYGLAGKMDDLDFKAGAPVKKLELAGRKTYSGNTADKFVDAKLFTFQDLTD